MLVQTKPKQSYRKKYQRGHPLSDKQIASYGRQILEALKYLEDIGFPYTHLHTANVIYHNEGDVCKYVKSFSNSSQLNFSRNNFLSGIYLQNIRI
jgi:serine/threonine protein kinase